MKENWYHAINGKSKAKHYFRDQKSLCGGYHGLMPSPGYHERDDRRCRVCESRLMKTIEKVKNVDNLDRRSLFKQQGIL